ncbi:MAG TPA: ureidoglycolate lyase [Bacteroidota bacterium]
MVVFMHAITPQKVSPQSFARFGRVVSTPTDAPTSQGPEYKFWSDIAHYEIGGETEIGLCTVYQQPDTTLSSVERHLRTPEILIPIDGPFILPLVREEGGKDVVEAFRVEVGEAVVINTGVWHGPCLPVGRTHESYFVIFRRRTPYEDVEKKQIATVHIA